MVSLANGAHSFVRGSSILAQNAALATTRQSIAEFRHHLLPVIPSHWRDPEICLAASTGFSPEAEVLKATPLRT